MQTRILLTGDFSHPDFSGLRLSPDAMTLVPLKHAVSSEAEYGLIIILQAYPDQHSRKLVEQLQARFPISPMVALLGSWCEGESRSGLPWPGVVRIYWHQWRGRFHRFQDRLKKVGVTNWHQPKTFSAADQISRSDPARSDDRLSTERNPPVGISAATASQFEMIADALKTFGHSAFWVERPPENLAGLLPPSLFCLDANDLNEEIVTRIKRLRGTYPQTPFIVLANFPRKDAIDRLVTLQVSQFLSKPFELEDLKHAVETAPRP
jgi:CheY-like chemotaxis protein